MKKIILGLMLLCSFSFSSNLYTENKVFIEGVKITSLIRFDLPINETEKIIKNVLRTFEVNNGTNDFLDFSYCSLQMELQTISDLKECEINNAIYDIFEALQDYTKEYQIKILQVYIASGYIVDLIIKKAERTQSNGKKKRI